MMFASFLFYQSKIVQFCIPLHGVPPLKCLGNPFGQLKKTIVLENGQRQTARHVADGDEYIDQRKGHHCRTFLNTVEKSNPA